MRKKIREMMGNNLCMKQRAFAFPMAEKKGEPFKKAVLVRELLWDIWAARITPEEVPERLEAAFKEFSFTSEEQRRLQMNETLWQVMRFVNSETRTPSPASTFDVPLGTSESGEEVIAQSVSPVAIFREDVPMVRIRKSSRGAKAVPLEGQFSLIPQIEVVSIKTRKPSSSIDRQKNWKRNIELFALLKYGRMVAPAGKMVRVKASIYYLRKANDNFRGGEVVEFDANFFDLRKGNNIISIEEDIFKPLGTPDGVDPLMTEMDEAYAPLLSTVTAGVPETECSQDDCKVCPLDALCHFVAPPLSVRESLKEGTLSSVHFTPNQRAAKEYENGVVRINAGAGAGKTFTVAFRVVALLNKGVLPEEIFITTFTNAGAKELRSRIRLYAEDDGIADEVDISKVRIQTFNGFGDEIIREEYARFGFSEPPTLVDDVLRFRIVAGMLNKAPRIPGLDYRNFDTNLPTCKGAVVIAAKVFEILKKDRDISFGDTEVVLRKLDRDAAFCTEESIPELYKLYREYDDNLRAENLIEYADQEGLLFELLQSEPYYFERFNFRHIIIDEFQDTSESQMDIIKRLTDCPSFESLMVVGDDSQSIYSFRDTSPEFMINFERVMGCRVDDIALLENFRSTPEILAFANAINRLNVNRVEKDLIPTRPSGAPVIVRGFFRPAEEISFIVSDIRRHLDAGVPAESIAVMARTKSELGAIADALTAAGIPSVIQYPEVLADNSRVKAAVAMANAIRDDEATKELMIYANALHAARTGDLLKDAPDPVIKSALEEAMVRIRAYRCVEDDEEKKEALQTLLAELNPVDADHPDGIDTLYASFVETLLGRPVSKIFSYVDDFCRYGGNVAVRRDGRYPGVVLSTAHSSKGLEWPVCYNMISKYDKPSLHQGGSYTQNRVEEERRLLFVSSTRARDELIVTGQYIAFGKEGAYTPNQFLLEAMNVKGREISPAGVLRMKAEDLARERAKRAEEKEKEREKEV